MQSPIGAILRRTTSLSCCLAAGVLLGCSGTETSNTNAGGNANSGGTVGMGGSNSLGGAKPTGGSTAVATGQSSTGGLSSASGSGGAAMTGGAAATGGMQTTGGATTAATGGVAATGGSKASGGTTAAGTTSPTGGKAATGGSVAGGGMSTATGGANPAGGASSTGGKSATGGVATTGGKSSTGGSSSTGGKANTGGATAAGGSTNTGGPGSSTELCTRWNADRADMSETGWTGSVSTCTVGDMSATGRANALRLLNLYRWIAALPPVATSAQHDQDDQACALMMAANNTLSHTPPTTWTCYSANGATAAGSSNIGGSGAVLAMAAYMVDPGNATTLGHRRWCLSNSLGPIGIGSTGTYSCMWTLNGTGAAGKTWLAWPPPGVFPIQAATDNWNRTLDTTGWSIQSDTINFASAVVTVTLNGTAMPVTVTQLAANYGSRYAISFIPSGWKLAAGNTYHVSITGITTAISYDVQVVSC